MANTDEHQKAVSEEMRSEHGTVQKKYIKGRLTTHHHEKRVASRIKRAAACLKPIELVMTVSDSCSAHETNLR